MYKIEITAETLAELAGKTATLAAKLNADTDGIWWQKTDAPQKLKKALDAAFEQGVAKKVDPVMPEVAEMAAAVPEPVTAAAETASLPSDTATAQPEPNESSETAKNIDASSASSGSAELNFDTDVAPYVLQVVKEKGKPVAQEILSQFGVEKASLLEPHLWPELVDQLKDAL